MNMCVACYALGLPHSRVQAALRLLTHVYHLPHKPCPAPAAFTCSKVRVLVEDIGRSMGELPPEVRLPGPAWATGCPAVVVRGGGCSQLMQSCHAPALLCCTCCHSTPVHMMHAA